MLQKKQLGITRITDAITFYLSTTGVDYEGDSTEQAPWATFAHAFDYIDRHIDQYKYSVIIQLADGTYDENIRTPPYTRKIVIVGNETDSNLVKISSTDTASYLVIIENSSYVTFRDLTFYSNNNLYGVLIKDASNVLMDNCILGNFTQTSLYGVDGGTLVDIRSMTLVANNTAAYIFLIAYQAQMRISGTLVFQTNISPTYIFYALRQSLITLTATVTGNPSGRAFSNMLSIIEGKSRFTANMIQQTSNGGLLI